MSHTELDLDAIAARLCEVDGIVGVCLGGSRARGTHRPDSDYDLGLYYRGTLDIAALAALARAWSGADAEITPPGAWGRWVNGGGWLRSGPYQVDWIYRDIDQVERVWAGCRAGRYEIGNQVGHPLGFYSHAYAGELALGRVLADPFGLLMPLRHQIGQYPSALAEALVRGVWEAEFCVAAAYKTAAAGDAAYVAGCLFRAVGVLCQAIHGHDHTWLINEKGMVAATALLPSAPPAFGERVTTLMGGIGTDPTALAASISAAHLLVEDTRRMLG